jgi:hypothetical protein
VEGEISGGREGVALLSRLLGFDPVACRAEEAAPR